MALDPRIILGLRPLASPAEMQDDRARREIANQEIELRRQDIDLRRQALQQRGIGQPKPFDPVAEGHAMDYRTKQIVTVSNLLKRAKADPSSYAQVRATIGQIVPDALSHLSPDYDDAAITGMIADGDALIAKEAKASGKTREIRVPQADGSERIMIVSDEPGQEWTAAPKPVTAAGAQGFTLAPGARRYDSGGKLIATAPERPEKTGPAAEKKPAQAEVLSAGYANRVEDAETTLRQLEKNISGMNVLSFEAQKRLSPAFQSSTYQQYDQAARNFVNAVLRRESGAAISEGEFENARQQYLPQPGNDAKTLELKRQNRATVLGSFAQAGGNAYTPRPKAASSTGPKVGDTVTYNKKRYKVVGIANGQAELEALP